MQSYIKTFDELKDRVSSLARPLKVVAVKPDDDATIAALERVRECQLAEIITINNTTIKQCLFRYPDLTTFIHYILRSFFITSLKYFEQDFKELPVINLSPFLLNAQFVRGNS